MSLTAQSNVPQNVTQFGFYNDDDDDDAVRVYYYYQCLSKLGTNDILRVVSFAKKVYPLKSDETHPYSHILKSYYIL